MSEIPTPLTLAPDGALSRSLTLVDRAAPGIVITRRAAEWLGSVHERTFEVVARETKLGAEEITVDVPNVDPHALVQLRDDGVIEVGTTVERGMILVGRVAPLPPGRGQSETEERLDAAFGVRTGVRDSSLRCPPDAEGVVVRAELERVGKKGVIARAEVVLRAERALAIGDVLRAGDRIGVVTAIVDSVDGGDAIWPGLEAQCEVEKVACAAHVAAARSIGPYSLVTQTPLGGKASFGGQLVTEAQIESLRARGAYHLLHELLTVKSDDVKGRVEHYTSIVLGQPRCASTLTTSAQSLGSHLRALALDVDLDIDRPSIRLFGDAGIRSAMRGVVGKPETLNYRTLAPEKGGLFCEAIFGSVLDGAARRTTEGRVVLPAPVLHPWLLAQTAILLDRTEKDVAAVLYGKSTLDGSEPVSWKDTAGWAIADALATLDLTALAAERSPRGALARTMLASGTEPSRFVFRAWPVLPPDLRPLVPLDGGRFATSDLNDLYRRVINRANRTARLVELAAPDIILRNEHVQLQQSVDSLVENGLRARKLTGPNKRALLSIADALGRPRGLLAIAAKRADYSACALAVPRPDLVDRAAVPVAIALELWKPFLYDRLEAGGHTSTIKESKRLVESGDVRAHEALAIVIRERPLVFFARDGSTPIALDVELWDEDAVGLPPASLQALGAAPLEPIVMHLPIDPLAVADARALDRVAPSDPVAPGWIARAIRARPTRAMREVLIAAALAGEIDPLTHDDARILLGRPPRH